MLGTGLEFDSGWLDGAALTYQQVRHLRMALIHSLEDIDREYLASRFERYHTGHTLYIEISQLLGETFA